MSDAPVDYEYVPISNIKGPPGSLGPIGFNGEPGEVGPRGPAGPASTDGLLTDDAIAAIFDNPEASSTSKVLSLVQGLLDSQKEKHVQIFTGGDINTARPSVQGRVVWESQIGRPTKMNLTKGDLWYAISSDPLAFDPLLLPGIFGYFDPTKTGVADGASITAYADQSPSAHNLATWVISSGAGATNNPVYRATGMGGKPAVQLIPRSGFVANFTISAPAYVGFAMNAQFVGTVPSATAQTANSLGGSDGGKYAITRTQAGTWGFSVDGLTAYSFGVSDALPHSFISFVTPTRAIVWVDGVVGLDQAISFAPLPSVSSYRLGYVATGSQNTSWKFMNDGFIGHTWGWVPSTAVTGDDVSTMTQFLKTKRGA